MSNKKNKTLFKKQRMSAMDIFFLIIGIALVVVTITYLSGGNPFDIGITGKNVTYTVTVEGIKGDYCEDFSVGDKIYDTTGKSVIGTVKSIDKKPMIEYIYDEETDSVTVRENNENKWTLTFTLVSKAEYIKGEGYLLNGNKVSVGNYLSFYIRNNYLTGKCLKLNASNQ